MSKDWISNHKPHYEIASSFDPFKIEGDCRNCGKRPATERWSAEGGALALSHGMWSPWCEVCVVEKQIEYAEEAVERLAALKSRLLEITSDRGEEDGA